jgi:hypothetical protein
MDFSLLISSLAAAREMAGLLIAERDREKAAAIKVELTEKIAQAQIQLLEVVGLAASQGEALHVARERIRELEADQRERERYQLVEVVPGRGVFAYRLRPAAELTERADEPVHFLCQPCRAGGITSVLQRSTNGFFLNCSMDGAHRIRIADDPPIHVEPMQSFF